MHLTLLNSMRFAQSHLSSLSRSFWIPSLPSSMLTALHSLVSLVPMLLQGFEECDRDGSSGDGWYAGDCCWGCGSGAEACAWRAGNALWMWPLAHICALTQQAFTADLCTLWEYGWWQFLVAAVEVTPCYTWVLMSVANTAITPNGTKALSILIFKGTAWLSQQCVCCLHRIL